MWKVGGRGLLLPIITYTAWDSATKGYISNSSGISKGKKFMILSKDRKIYILI